ncbi:FKBP-type peptidyl-prolyl cis-trans isomerase 2 [Bacilli bacterium PM5-3]|nr:FKBP-type peptidyl-prolyl cis-trans isomerase 2 [Bacilli bacterium PM5-3]
MSDAKDKKEQTTEVEEKKTKKAATKKTATKKTDEKKTTAKKTTTKKADEKKTTAKKATTKKTDEKKTTAKKATTKKTDEKKTTAKKATTKKTDEKKTTAKKATTKKTDEKKTEVNDTVSVDKDSIISEEIMMADVDTNKGPELDIKSNSKNKKQFVVWGLILVAVIGLMFAVKGFPTITNSERKAFDKEVNQLILSTQVNFADEETGAAIKKGDVVLMDFTGYIDNKAFDGGSASDQKIQVGGGMLIDGFDDQLIGKKKGEKVDVKVTFPKDYGNEALNGKKATFKVTIKNVYNLPEADDDLAKKYVEAATAQGDTTAKDIKSFNDFKKYLINYLKEMEAYYKAMEQQQQQQQQGEETTTNENE